jgi:hypothetical protein
MPTIPANITTPQWTSGPRGVTDHSRQKWVQVFKRHQKHGQHGQLCFVTG